MHFQLFRGLNIFFCAILFLKIFYFSYSYLYCKPVDNNYQVVLIIKLNIQLLLYIIKLNIKDLGCYETAAVA